MLWQIHSVLVMRADFEKKDKFYDFLATFLVVKVSNGKRNMYNC